MSWVHSLRLVGVLVALTRGHNTLFEGYDLSMSGYHLCTGHETVHVSALVTHTVPYTVQRPCGGWLPWKTCSVTLYKMIHCTDYKTVTKEITRCCQGFEQVGSYCAMTLNRTREFTTKPGSCSADEDVPVKGKVCLWDIDCPGWQKCCQSSRVSRCIDPADASHDSENGRWNLNVTVIIKTDYQRIISMTKGLLIHTRLLHAMVTGAMNSSDVSVYYVSSWPVDPYRTASSLLIGCNVTLSLADATEKMYLLLKHVAEVSSVTVDDVDECTHRSLNYCSPQAECSNTVGSYHCTCRQGYRDVLPHNSGVSCEADLSTTEPPVHSTTVPTGTYDPSAPVSHTPISINTHGAPENHTMASFNSTVENHTMATFNSTVENHTEAIFNPTVQNQTMAMFNSTDSTVPTTALLISAAIMSHSESAQTPQTSTAPYTSVTWPLEVQPPACAPPQLTELRVSSLTGTSFRMYWSSLFQDNQTYLIALVQGSEVIRHWQTNQSTWEVMRLMPGVLYNVIVIPCACGAQGDRFQLSVKTAAQTLAATARVTNIEFIEDLLNSSSQAYINLTTSIEEEVYQSLSPEVSKLVDSGKVRIEISSLSRGSVVVNFNIVFIPSEGDDILNVSKALMSSLLNGTKYSLDENNTHVSDFDECTTGQNDCSHNAKCNNTWASYTCVCLAGFKDTDPDRPGRACQALLETTTQSWISTNSSPTTATPTSVPTSTSTSTLLTTSTSVPTSTSTSTLLTTSTSVPTSTSTSTLLTTSTSVPTSTATLTTSTSVPTSTATLTTSTSVPTSTATLTTSTSVPTSTATLTTSTSVPTSTATLLTTSTSVSTSTATLTTSTSVPTSTSTSTLLTTSTSVPTSTATLTTSTSVPTSIAILLATSTSVPTSPATTAMITGTTTPAVTIGKVTPAISVQCRATTITVTVTKEFLLSNQISDLSLYLGLKECGVNGGNTTHVQLTVAWNKCDTKLLHNDSYYTAQVTLSNTMDSQLNSTVMVPQLNLQVPIMCTYKKNVLISTQYGPMGYDMFKDTILGSGAFQVTMRLMNGTFPLPQNYSLSPEEDVVVEVSLNTTVEQIKVVISKCWATPSMFSTYTSSYVFLENSCPLPNTYSAVLTNGNSSTSSLSVRIFSFVQLDVIYLHCQIQICVEMASASCVTDCRERKGRLLNTIGTVFGSSNALFRLNDEGLDEKMNILHLVGFSFLGIGLALLFLGSLICFFFYQRNRIGHYNFSLKPKQENFTYLVFNT